MKYIEITLLFIMLLLSAVNAFTQGTWITYTHTYVKGIRDIALHEDYLWCATSDGLVRLDTRTMTYKKYTASDGLIDNKVYSRIKIFFNK